MLRLERCAKVSRLLRIYPVFRRGIVTTIAGVLGVSVATISRDKARRPCPCCGALAIIGPDPAEAVEDLPDDDPLT